MLLDGSETLTNPTSTTIADGLATNFSGGTITGAGTFNFTAALNWTAGTMSGAGVTNASGGLTIGQAADNGSYVTYLDQRTFNNTGAATIVRSATGSYTYLYFLDGALFDNKPGASFAFADDSTYINNDGGTPNGGTFLNEGALTKAGSTGYSDFGSSITFNSTSPSTIAVNSGELTFEGGGTISTTSPITAASGAVARILHRLLHLPRRRHLLGGRHAAARRIGDADQPDQHDDRRWPGHQLQRRHDYRGGHLQLHRRVDLDRRDDVGHGRDQLQRQADHRPGRRQRQL